MNIKELKESLKEEIGSETWLINQYPPKNRYSQKTYLNFQNLRDVFPKEENLEGELKRFMVDRPENTIVVLKQLNHKGQSFGKPIILLNPDSIYYGQYVLFAIAYNLKGYVEIFHNKKE